MFANKLSVASQISYMRMTEKQRKIGLIDPFVRRYWNCPFSLASSKPQGMQRHCEPPLTLEY